MIDKYNNMLYYIYCQTKKEEELNMKCYVIYSQKTIWLTENFEEKDSGYSIQYDSISELIKEFRENIEEYKQYRVFEEFADETGKSFFKETSALNV